MAEQQENKNVGYTLLHFESATEKLGVHLGSITLYNIMKIGNEYCLTITVGKTKHGITTTDRDVANKWVKMLGDNSPFEG